MAAKSSKNNFYIEDFRTGDQLQFSQVFDLYYNRMYLFAQNLIKTQAEAKDIATESFMKLWKLRENFESLGNIKSFLYLTTRNACIDHLRSLQRRRAVQKEILYLLDDAHGIENAMIEAEVFNELAKQIDKLPFMCKKIFKLIYYNSLETSEVAERLNITQRNVLNQKARAINFLKSTSLVKNAFLESTFLILLFILPIFS